MFDRQHAKQPNISQMQITHEQKQTSTKRPHQRIEDSTRLPLYTQAWGNQTPPWLRRFTPQRENHKQNTTGLPETLKAGIENLSGLSMDDVQVHYNSSEPVQVQALASTQGTDIHVGPGQERHLAHEAWHVVQQKQGRVRPTMQLQGIGINDDTSLEREADVMGARANNTYNSALLLTKQSVIQGDTAVIQRVKFTDLNLEEQSYWKEMTSFLRGKANVRNTAEFNKWKDALSRDKFREYMKEFKETILDKLPSGVDWLNSQLKTAKNGEIFVGYLGTSSVYQKSIEEGINPPRGGTRGIAGEQLGYGLYLATQLEGGKHYAIEQHQNQLSRGKKESQPIVYEVYAPVSFANPRFAMDIKISQWWASYSDEIDKQFRVVSAPISGQFDKGPQLKFTEQTFAYLKARNPKEVADQ